MEKLNEAHDINEELKKDQAKLRNIIASNVKLLPKTMPYSERTKLLKELFLDPIMVKREKDTIMHPKDYVELALRHPILYTAYTMTFELMVKTPNTKYSDALLLLKSSLAKPSLKLQDKCPESIKSFRGPMGYKIAELQQPKQ